jgi:hypothetical protein
MQITVTRQSKGCAMSNLSDCGTVGSSSIPDNRTVTCVWRPCICVCVCLLFMWGRYDGPNPPSKEPHQSVEGTHKSVEEKT